MTHRKHDFSRKRESQLLLQKPKPAPKKKVRAPARAPRIKMTKKFEALVQRNKENNSKRIQIIENIKQEETKRKKKHKQNIAKFKKYWKGKEGSEPTQSKGAPQDGRDAGLFEEETVEGDQMAVQRSPGLSGGGAKGANLFARNKGVFSKLRRNIDKNVLDKPKLMESFGLRSKILNMYYNELYK